MGLIVIPYNELSHTLIKRDLFYYFFKYSLLLLQFFNIMIHIHCLVDIL